MSIYSLWPNFTRIVALGLIGFKVSLKPWGPGKAALRPSDGRSTGSFLLGPRNKRNNNGLEQTPDFLLLSILRTWLGEK